MQQEIKKIEVLKNSMIPVLIYGESGTGKELFSRALHYHSSRKNGTFVPVNCAAIPSSLLEAELFGYSRGSFTGAQYDYEGLIPGANGGTLFLDEIGEMPLELQPKLLRVLEEGEVQSIGRRGRIKVDFRLVSATNRDLEQEMLQGRFREDLYYRIRGCEIRIPPLRERPEDIHLLAGYFLQIHISGDGESKGVSFSEKVLKIFNNYAWPGNIRELRSVVQTSCLFRNKEKNLITEDSLPVSLNRATAPTVTKERGLSDKLIIDLYKMSKEKAIASNNGCQFVSALIIMSCLFC
jgi:Nif-specific regulatory protein